jgi:3D (Asp-Asp-Asp) domain-containing protein
MKVKKSRKKTPYKRPKAWALFALVLVIFSGVLFGVYSLSKSNEDNNILSLEDSSELIIFQENTLVSVSNPNDPPLKTIGTLPVIITAYSSTPCQTDDTPFITAAGTSVRDGIVANNYLSFGTKIRIPELYGEKVFVVEDRMHWKKSNYHIDVWFLEYSEALAFGAQRTYIEVLGR